MKTLAINGLSLGRGRPKICAPLVAEKADDLLLEAERGRALPVDLWEWRVDYFEGADDPGQVIEMAGRLRERLRPKPLLVTFRRLAEGGVRACSESYYFSLLRQIALSGRVDLLDLELSSPEELIREILGTAQSNLVGTILSSHDFQGTPAKAVMLERLLMMRRLGADLGKIAVTPQSPADVLRLLEVTDEIRITCPDWPIISIAMGHLGLISRLTGGIFGSVITFGSAGRASAPGQIPVAELARLLRLFHSEDSSHPG